MKEKKQTKKKEEQHVSPGQEAEERKHMSYAEIEQDKMDSSKKW
ncbi:hypothetical protein [Thalassobacillus sp. C254]|nr:hypothetical protein [Thalassobacillus sp. C254]